MGIKQNTFEELYEFYKKYSKVATNLRSDIILSKEVGTKQYKSARTQFLTIVSEDSKFERKFNTVKEKFGIKGNLTKEIIAELDAINNREMETEFFNELETEYIKNYTIKLNEDIIKRQDITVSKSIIENFQEILKVGELKEKEYRAKEILEIVINNFNELVARKIREKFDDFTVSKKLSDDFLNADTYKKISEFWVEYKKNKDTSYSISLKIHSDGINSFYGQTKKTNISTNNDGWMIMLEIKNKGGNFEKRLIKFNESILDADLPENFFYIVYYKKNKKSPLIIDSKDRILREYKENKDTIEKIKIKSAIAFRNREDDEILEEIYSKFSKLMPIYEKLLSENDLEQSTIEIKNEEKNMENTNDLPIQYPIQKILFGAPGTGKSYKIQSIIQKDIENYKDTDDNERVFRTTIHSEYTYFDFIGSILPETEIDEETKQSEIKYEFTPGIFTLALEKALSTDEDENVYLIIEELSRGNIAAIFGDIFQLLDRDVDSGESSYHINNSQITEYLLKSKKLDWNKRKIYIPKNLNIIATMNTSDQNVNVVDTAFKRRFDFEYLSIDVPENAVQDINIFENVSWKEFNEVINDYIVNEMELSEDKQLGHYFVKFKKGVSLEQNQEVFKNKIMHYLWEDVQGASISDENKIFAEEYKSFSKLYSAFGTQKEKIFSKNILEKLGLSIDNNDESVDNNEEADVPQD